MEGRRERKRVWAFMALIVACAALCSARPAAAQVQESSFWRNNTLVTPWPAMDGAVPLFDWGDTGWLRFQRPAAPSWFVFRRGLYSAPIVFFARKRGTTGAPNTFYSYCSKSVAASRGTDYNTYTDPRLSPARAGIDFGFYCAPGTDPRLAASWTVGRAQLAKNFAAGTPPVVSELTAAGFWTRDATTNNPVVPAATLTPGAWEVRAFQNEDFADRNGKLDWVAAANPTSWPATMPTGWLVEKEIITNDVNNDGRYDYPEPFDDQNGDGIRQASEPYQDMGNGWYDPPEPFRDDNGNGRQNGNEPYWDVNGNGAWDDGEPITTDLNGNGCYDPPEPFADYNGNGARDAGEPYMDLNGNGAYDTGDTFTDEGNNRYDPGDSYDDANGNGQFDPWDYFADANRNGLMDPDELYTDMNGNGQWDVGEPLTDADGNGTWTPGDPQHDRYGNGIYTVGEPFLDENANTVYDLRTEPYTDANGNGEWDAGEAYTDTKYFEANPSGAFDSALVGPIDVRVMNPISVLAGAGAPPWATADTTCADGPSNFANGNPDFGFVPGKRVLTGVATAPAWSWGRVSHGATSTTYRFAVVDRSHLANVPYLVPAGIRMNCRMAHGDLNPTLDPTHPPTNMDWWYDLLEYPPIFSDRIVIRKVGDGRDPRQESIDLPMRGEPWVDIDGNGVFDAPEPYTDTNGNGQWDPAEPFTDTNGDGNCGRDQFSDENGNGVRDAGNIKPVVFEAYVRVPKYQPDTTYGTGWEAIAQDAARLPAVTGVPASDPIRVWYDLDGDGRLRRMPAPTPVPGDEVLCDTDYYTDAARNDGAERVANYEMYEAAELHAEPYREINLTLNVPTDFRFRVEEPALDLGKQPHNTAASTGLPHPWSARPITVTNLGNVNLLRLRIAPDRAYLSTRDPRRSGYLFTPDSDYDRNQIWDGLAADKGSQTAGLGVNIPWGTPEPAATDAPERPTTPYARKHIWWSFGGDDPVNPDPSEWENPTGTSFVSGVLRKARPDAAEPSGLQGRWHAGASWTAAGYVGPRVGVVTPFGQPVGDYSNQFVVYEDRNDSGALDAGDSPSLGAFRVKVTVTDRQLTEEPTAYSIDRPVVGAIGNTDPTQDYAGTFMTWAVPHASNPAQTRYIFGSDSQPAAVRFGNTAHRRLALFWTSNRPDATQVGGAARLPQPPAASVAAYEQPQSWYLYGTRSYEIKDNNAATADHWPFWANRFPNYDLTDDSTRLASAAPPEVKAPAASLFAGRLANAGTLISERYTAPTVVQTIAANGQVGQPNYLFFQGVGQGRDAGGRTYRASQVFYTALEADFAVNSGTPTVNVGIEQPEVTKHSPRALSYIDGTGVHRLWAFWHGGAENAWQGYFSLNKGDKAVAANWRLSDGRGFAMLPLYGDFANVQDIVPLYRPGPHTNFLTGASTSTPMIDVVFTGFSKSRGNSDLFMARLDAARLEWGTRGAWRAKQAFAPVERELLGNTNNRVYTSQHLEWMTSPLYRTTAGTRRFVFPRIYRKRPADAQPVLITPNPQDPAHTTSQYNWAAATAWQYDEDGSRWTYDWKTGFQSSSNPSLDGGNTITLYPLTGQVVFAKPLDPGDEVYVDYVPTILRVAGSPQMEASPAVFMDNRYAPGQSPVDSTRIYRYPDGRYISRDRMWLFWTRVAPQVSKPTVWYKTMRLMVPLPRPIQPGTAVTVTDEFGVAITQFTVDTGVDPANGRVLYPGRLFFPASQTAGALRGLDGRRITVAYTEAGTGNAGPAPLDPYIRWRDERPEAPLPIDDVANEGSLCAIPDMPLGVDFTDAASVRNYLGDAGTWRVWLFWTSSRPKAIVYNAATGQPVQFSNDTDLRYMALAPRLDFRPTLPGGATP